MRNLVPELRNSGYETPIYILSPARLADLAKRARRDQARSAEVRGGVGKTSLCKGHYPPVP